MAKNETAEPKRDWVNEAYESFVKDAKDIDPTDPVKAIAAYFKKNATDALKERCKAEGKDAKSCWDFVMAVARKALGGRNGHIDPAVVYAIAMHYFEDVPKDWSKTQTASKPAKTSEKKPKAKKPEAKPAEGKAEAPRQKRKAESLQGFFFDALETPPPGETAETQGGEP